MSILSEVAHKVIEKVFGSPKSSTKSSIKLPDKTVAIAIAVVAIVVVVATVGGGGVLKLDNSTVSMGNIGSVGGDVLIKSTKDTNETGE